MNFTQTDEEEGLKINNQQSDDECQKLSEKSQSRMEVHEPVGVDHLEEQLKDFDTQT